MFASIAQPPPHPRRATPFLLALLLNGGVFGGLLLLGAREIARAAPAEVSLERPYELVVPPGPPASGSPAPKPATRSTAARRSAPAVVPAVTPPVAPAPLPEPAPSADMTLTPVLDADGDGPEGGEGGGGPGMGPGVGEGPGDGGGGGGGPGLRVVHWSEVAVKVRAQVRPSDYPAAASALDLPDARCVVRMEVDRAGVPDAVRVKTCPEVFRVAAENVARRYRFYPLMVEGRAVSAAFELTINFRRD